MTQRARTSRSRPLPLGWIAVGAVALAAVVVMALSLGGAPTEVGEPRLTGQALPALADGGDAAIGLAAPFVTGADFDGSAVVIEPGRPTAVVFLAHWCPHCQAEVPAVRDWLQSTGGVAGTNIVSVVTGVDSLRDNYPPSDWLERENWPVPALLDDAEGSVFTAFGGTAFPYWVLLEADGTVAFRAAGSVPTGDLERALSALVG